MRGEVKGGSRVRKEEGRKEGVNKMGGWNEGRTEK